MSGDKRAEGGGFDASQWLMGSVVVATAFLTFLGLEGDALSRLIRVSPDALRAGAVLLVVAVALGVVAAAFVTGKKFRFWLQVAGLLAFLAGVVILVWAHADATSEQQRPTVSTKLSIQGSQMSADIQLTAAGLKPEEYLFVIVQGANGRKYLAQRRIGFNPRATQSPPPREYSLQPLYKGRVGPSPTGDIDVALTVPVTEGLYDQLWIKARIIESTGESKLQDERRIEFGSRGGFGCTGETVDTACAVLIVPEDVEAPSNSGSHPEGDS